MYIYDYSVKAFFSHTHTHSSSRGGGGVGVERGVLLFISAAENGSTTY